MQHDEDLVCHALQVQVKVQVDILRLHVVLALLPGQVVDEADAKQRAKGHFESHRVISLVLHREVEPTVLESTIEFKGGNVDHGDAFVPKEGLVSLSWLRDHLLDSLSSFLVLRLVSIEGAEAGALNVLVNDAHSVIVQVYRSFVDCGSDLLRDFGRVLKLRSNRGNLVGI